MLNMRSAPDDRTTSARIRDAAIVRFPIDGISGTTIRSIAAEAGVSPGLVIHHFGTKEGLRSACDEYVVHRVMDTKRDALVNRSYRQPGGVAELYQLAEPTLRYLAWALSIGGATSSRIFDELLDEAEGLLIDGRDAGLIDEIYGEPRKQAALLVATQLSTLIFHEQLSRALGHDMLSVEGLVAAAPYALQIFSGDLFDKDVIAEARESLIEQNPNREAVS